MADKLVVIHFIGFAGVLPLTVPPAPPEKL